MSSDEKAPIPSGRDLPVVIAAVVIGMAGTAFFFYPGYLNPDSNWQYQQQLTGEYWDIHPVIMPWVWSYLDRVVEGPGGLFLLTALLYWTGLALSVRCFTRSVAGSLIATALIGFFPAIFAMLSQVHKDTGMTAGLIFGFALLLTADRRHSLAALLVAVPGLWYAFAIRHNGAAAVLPFSLWMGFLLVRDHLPRSLRLRLASPVWKTATQFPSPSEAMWGR